MYSLREYQLSFYTVQVIFTMYNIYITVHIWRHTCIHKLKT